MFQGLTLKYTHWQVLFFVVTKSNSGVRLLGFRSLFFLLLYEQLKLFDLSELHFPHL